MVYANRLQTTLLHYYDVNNNDTATTNQKTLFVDYNFNQNIYLDYLYVKPTLCAHRIKLLDKYMIFSFSKHKMKILKSEHFSAPYIQTIAGLYGMSFLLKEEMITSLGSYSNCQFATIRSYYTVRVKMFSVLR